MIDPMTGNMIDDPNISVPSLPSPSVSIPTPDPTPRDFSFTVNGIPIPKISVSWPTGISLPKRHIPRLPHFTKPSFQIPPISIQPPTIDVMKMAVAALVKAQISALIEAAKAANGIVYTVTSVIPTNVQVGVSISSPTLPTVPTIP